MSGVLIQKDDTIIRVAADAVDGHERLGWSRVVNIYGGDALTLAADEQIQHRYGSGELIPSVNFKHYQILPAAASVDAIHAAIALDDADAQIITGGITQPDYPRILSITGNAADLAGNVVIIGRNVEGVMIAEIIALDETSTVPGTLAFAEILSIEVPARTTAGDTVSVGWGDVFGMPELMDYAACLLLKLFDGATDAGTLVLDADEIEKCTYAPAGTPDGSPVDLYYLA